MRRLWFAIVIVATYGSLYPFDFHAVDLNAALVNAFLETCCRMSTRGDILGNVILFVPFGFLGMISCARKYSATRSLVLVCLIGAVFALVLQLIQFYLPSRNESLQDVYWNLFGTACGIVVAGAAGRFSLPVDAQRADMSLIPFTLVACWLTYRLLPFVPSLNLEFLKSSLKPLATPLNPVNVVHDFAAWTVVAYLLSHVRRGRPLDSYLPAIIVSVFFLEVLIIDNSVSASNVAGAVIALIFWWGALQRARSQESILVFLLLSSLLISGLAPFTFSSYPIPFNWLPFYGLLGDAMYQHTQSAAEKVFLYGSLVYLLWRMRVNRAGAIFVGLSIVTVIEFAQTRFLGHVPEITDPILVICAALVLTVLERKEAHSVTRQKWITQTINLYSSQYAFLEQLSREMERSVSGVARAIIGQFIEKLDQDTESATAPDLTLRYEDYRENWMTQTIHLREDQFQTLCGLSNRMHISVSDLVSRIITIFIAEIDEGDR